MIDLRQSTASQEVHLGHFKDETDGFTSETGLTIANTDIKLWKNGATAEVSKNSGGATHMVDGRYYAVLDATDTNTCGALIINVHVAGARNVERVCRVLPANVYDSAIAGTSQTTAADIAAETITEMETSTILLAISAGVTALPTTLDDAFVDGTVTWADAKVLNLAFIGGDRTGLQSRSATQVFKNQAGTAAITSVQSGTAATVTLTP